jgi:holliday junction DNA helicase RuvB
LLYAEYITYTTAYMKWATDEYVSDVPHARVQDADAATVERVAEAALRPKKLAEFVGQSHITVPLGMALMAARDRSESVDHVLLYGNPGLGKTTLAGIVAAEIAGAFHATSGPAIARAGDLAAILTQLSRGSVLFVDEIHRLSPAVEEVLYSAMEDYAIDLVIGKGPGSRSVRMNVEPFTLIGATTRLNMLSAPLRDRFGHVYHVEPYSTDDIEKVVERSAALLRVQMDTAARRAIADRSRSTPRVANRLLRRVRDYAQVHKHDILGSEAASATFDLLSIDSLGLDALDRKVLHALVHTFQCGPVGVNTLSAAIGEDVDTIETVCEPYLLQVGMLDRTPRGRQATAKARHHIEKNV